MSTYRMQDGTIVKSESAVQRWEERTEWNGSNHISVQTGSQFSHQTLYKTRKGRYWIKRTSNYQGTTDTAEFVSPQEAARWLLLNGDELPDDLKQYEDEVSE